MTDSPSCPICGRVFTRFSIISHVEICMMKSSNPEPTVEPVDFQNPRNNNFRTVKYGNENVISSGSKDASQTQHRMPSVGSRSGALLHPNNYEDLSAFRRPQLQGLGSNSSTTNGISTKRATNINNAVIDLSRWSYDEGTELGGDRGGRGGSGDKDSNTSNRDQSVLSMRPVSNVCATVQSIARSGSKRSAERSINSNSSNKIISLQPSPSAINIDGVVVKSSQALSPTSCESYVRLIRALNYTIFDIHTLTCLNYWSDIGRAEH